MCVYHPAIGTASRLGSNDDGPALYKPLAISASALSLHSPLSPMDGSILCDPPRPSPQLHEQNVRPHSFVDASESNARQTA